MTNRFERLYQLPENQYIKDSPIILAAGVLLKDTETGSIIAQLKFQSVSVKLIKAVKVSLAAYDISGAEIQGVSDYQYLELNVSNGQEFGGNKAIVLPNSVTRSLAVTSTIVVFDDGTMWENSEQFSMLSSALPLSFEDAELEKQYRIATNNHANYRPCKDKGLWQCSCGKWNSGEACTHCRLTCDKAFSALNIPLLTEQKNARLAAKAEQERIAAEEKYKKKQQQNERARKVGSIAFKVFLIALVATALVCLAITIKDKVIIPNAVYNDAVKLMEKGDYDAARDAFLSLNGYKDSEELSQQCEDAIIDAKYENAVQLMNSGDYLDAITAFEELGDYKDSKELINQCDTAVLESAYNQAILLMSEEKYIEAIHAFEELNGYKDSTTKILECENCILEQQYNDAVQLMESGKYEEAIAAFETLNDYSDCKQKIVECHNAIKEISYNAAIELIGQGKYREAAASLASLGDYKDAIELSKRYGFLGCEVGDTIFFGKYEQDNNLNNGTEDIEWIVLDRQGDKALVISKYCIEWLPFHNTFTKVGWRGSSIRSWLNSTFLNGAFSSQESSSILNTQNTNPDFYDDSETEKTALGTTTDRIFLLSSGEANTYFSSDSARRAEGTDYACNKGKSASWYWWLRSANNIEYAGFVSEGELGYGEEVDRNMGIRPAMWIEITE